VPAGYRVEVFAAGLNRPTAIAFGPGGTLIVSAQGALWRVNARQRKAIVSNLSFGRHQQDNVVVHRGRLYFGSGSTCDVCSERSRLSAAVLSVRPDGRDLRVVARGSGTRTGWLSILQRGASTRRSTSATSSSRTSRLRRSWRSGKAGTSSGRAAGRAVV
jgi:hypothetical protein